MTEANLLSNAQLDLTDAHNYGGSVGLMRAPGAGTMSSGVDRALDKPFMLSEWNPDRKEEYRACAFPLISLYGQCLNGWDAPMEFGCRRTGWSFYNYFWDYDINYPSDIAQYPAMALAIRRGDLKEGPVVYRKMVGKPEAFAESLDAKHAYEAPYFAIGKVGTQFTDAPQPDFLAQDVIDKAWDKKAGIVASATGELVWDYDRGIATCRAPRTQGAVGFLSRQKPIALPAADLALQTPFAAVWLSSLTDQPIADSTKILITTAGRQTVMDLSALPGKPAPVYKPMIIEAIQGTLSLKSSLADKAKVYAIGFDGRPTKELEAKKSDDRIEFDFDTMDAKGPYFLVTSEPVVTEPTPTSAAPTPAASAPAPAKP